MTKHELSIEEVIGGEPKPPETFWLGIDIPVSPEEDPDSKSLFAILGSAEDIAKRIEGMRAPQGFGGNAEYVHRGWRFDDLAEARVFRDLVLAATAEWGWAGVKSFIQGRGGHFIDGSTDHYPWIREKRQKESK